MKQPDSKADAHDVIKKEPTLDTEMI